MPNTQRVAQFIQRLAYENLVQADERIDRDERPADASPRSVEPTPSYSAWNATSFSSYVPFRGPTNS